MLYDRPDSKDSLFQILLYKESEKHHSQSDDICVLQAVSRIVLSTFGPVWWCSGL